MSFWERYRKVIGFSGIVVFVFAVLWLSYLRVKHEETTDAVAKNAALCGQLPKYFCALKSDPKLQHKPALTEVRRETNIRLLQFEKQLKMLTKRVKFPFSKDFPWTDRKAIPTSMSWGVYVNTRYPVTSENVAAHCISQGKATHLREHWLGFVPSPTPASVTVEKAEDNLRRLALAEKITKLAIDSGISWVLDVSPDKVDPDGAHYWGYQGRKQVRLAYKNKFIRNYPVQVRMIGSLDSIMRFFHSVRGKNHFLVIRYFQISSGASAGISAGFKEYMKPGELFVDFSAACMDFDEGKPKPATRTTPTIPAADPNGYVPPSQPQGH